MTRPRGETTEESPTETNDSWCRLQRRPLLKALGVGSLLSLGGVATASGGESGQQSTEEGDGGDEHARRIDSVFGYPTTDPGAVPDELEPDHEVELHRQFPEDPENPEHPAIFHFAPSGLHVDSGDIVQFTFSDPNHTVTAYHPNHGFQRRVPEGVPAFSAPIVQQDGAWLYRFDQEGLYDVYCGPHEIAGMAMRLVVGELGEEDVPEYEDTFEAEPPLFPPLSPQMLEHELNANSDRNENVEWVWPTDREVLDTDALDPMNIQQAGQVPYAEVADELGVAFEPGEAHD